MYNIIILYVDCRLYIFVSKFSLGVPISPLNHCAFMVSSEIINLVALLFTRFKVKMSRKSSVFVNQSTLYFTVLVTAVDHSALSYCLSPPNLCVLPVDVWSKSIVTRQAICIFLKQLCIRVK